MNAWDNKLTPLEDDMKGLKSLVGAEIVNIGYHPSQKEGGLSFDYKKNDKTYRVVLGYTELGVWISWQGAIGKEEAKQLNTLKKKLVDLDKKYEELVILQEKDCEVKDDPRTLSFHFVIDGKEIMSLSVTEIKLLPKNLQSLFTKKIRFDHFIAQLAASGWTQEATEENFKE